MATHGTIRLTSKVEKGTILLQTPHDGHACRALKLLTGDDKHEAYPVHGLPRWIAEQTAYRPNCVADRYINPSEFIPAKVPTLETFQDWEQCHATCELCLIELAAWIVACCPMTYRVIPPLFQGSYLADYDREESGHLQVEILDDRSYRIKKHKQLEIPEAITVDLIAEVHRIHLGMAQALIAKAKNNQQGT